MMASAGTCVLFDRPENNRFFERIARNVNDGLYHIPSRSPKGMMACKLYEAGNPKYSPKIKESSSHKSVWWGWMGHVNKTRIWCMLSKIRYNIKHDATKNQFPCEPCIVTKKKKMPATKELVQHSKVMNIRTDIGGLIRKVMYGGKQLFVTFTTPLQ